ncbi:hypothetical protein BH23GEM9_BH23GEM9_35150 [soil metagenome]
MKTRGSRPWNPLERKLPILIGGVVALLLVTAFGVTQYEVRQSAIEAAGERLGSLAVQVGDWIDDAILARARLMENIAADPALIALLDGTADDVGAATAVLDRLRVRSDSGLPVQLRDESGRLVLVSAGTGVVELADDAATTTQRRNADLPQHEVLPHDAVLAPVDAEAISYGPFFESGSAGRYWVTIPVRQGGRTLGHIHQLRNVGSTSVAERLEPLLGRNIEIYFANREGAGWVALDGAFSGNASPVTITGAPFARTGHDGASHYSVARPVAATDWLLVVDMPMNTVLSATRTVARRVLATGFLLMLLGGLAAWLVSRSVTAPLRRLGYAADAIAAGDYSRRTGIERTDEIGHLAHSFDAMAGHVETTHVELEHRFQEARVLAAELSDANARLRHAVDEIDAARSEAQQASRAKSEFLATISHEIRTPINAIIGYTDLMELGLAGPLSAQQQDYVERIRRSSDHLTTLVNDVLDFAKLESGQMRVSHDVRSARQTIDAAVSMLQAHAAARRIDVRTDCAVETVFLGDDHRVQQILLNLLSNALKFTPEHGTISVSCQRRASHAHPPLPDESDHHEWTCVSVTDSGIGIPADQHERIFQPFVQAQSGYTRPHGGAGLGLAISRSLARLMGGDISVESRPGDGASFTVWLPHPAGSATVAAAARNTRAR